MNVWLQLFQPVIDAFVALLLSWIQSWGGVVVTCICVMPLLGGCVLDQLTPDGPVEPPVCHAGLDADGHWFWDCPVFDDD